MAQGIFGYFKFNINGTKLTGIYMNWNTTGLEDEIGHKTGNNPGVFDGSYETSWTDTAFRQADLTITHDGNNSFTLNWIITNDNPATQFRGRGVIDNEALVGFYEMLP